MLETKKRNNAGRYRNAGSEEGRYGVKWWMLDEGGVCEKWGLGGMEVT
jgi:hypothetical protein